MKISTLPLVVLTLAVSLFAQDPPSCPYKKIPAKRVGGYELTISEIAANEKDPQKKEDIQDKAAARCVAAVVSGSAVQVAIGSDWSLSWLAATGTDINGDGAPDAILEGYSGGAHCCWSYWFVDLGEHPGVYLNLENEREIVIDTKTPGHTYIQTLDGAFDYFDGLCHACTPFPSVVLELRGKQLSDVGGLFVDEYDKEIAAAKYKFEHEDGEEFAVLASFKPGLEGKYADARSAALAVVFGYLYSNREDQAWQALNSMWPVSDQARIKKLILETRALGILSQIGTSLTDSTHRDSSNAD